MSEIEQSRWASTSGAPATGGPAPAAEEIGVMPARVASSGTRAMAAVSAAEEIGLGR